MKIKEKVNYVIRSKERLEAFINDCLEQDLERVSGLKCVLMGFDTTKKHIITVFQREIHVTSHNLY